MPTTRRDFLVTSAALAASLAAPALAQRAPAKKNLGYAVVGIGGLSTSQIIPALAETKSSRLAALVTGHPEKTVPILPKFGLDNTAVYSYENFDQLAKNPNVDVVYIVLPNSMHAEYTLRALKAGKHVLCEKPMATTSADCQKMIDAAKAANKKLMIAYRCHFDPTNLKAIEMLHTTQFQKPRFIIADHSYRMTGGWRMDKKLAGGGPIFDVGIYSLNAARYLTGEEPISVSAFITENPTDLRFKEIEEAMAWTMKFPSGALATCTTSYNATVTNHIRITCERGTLEMEPATSYTGNKLRNPPNPAPIPTTDLNQFAAEMDHLSDCILNNKDPLTPGSEGLQDIKLIEALYESARTGKAIKTA